MMLILQLFLFCLLFTLMVVIAARGSGLNCLYFYPKPYQEKAYASGIADREEIRKKRLRFMIPFFLVMGTALVLIVGKWNGIREFKPAWIQALIFLEVMNWYDGIIIDRLWVGHSKIWKISGMEGFPYVQTWPQILRKRCILSLIWIIGAATLALIIVLLF